MSELLRRAIGARGAEDAGRVREEGSAGSTKGLPPSALRSPELGPKPPPRSRCRPPRKTENAAISAGAEVHRREQLPQCRRDFKADRARAACLRGRREVNLSDDAAVVVEPFEIDLFPIE